jgi:hypothetical protein
MQDDSTKEFPNIKGEVNGSPVPKRKPPKLRKGPTSRPEANSSNKNAIDGAPIPDLSNDSFADARSSSSGDKFNHRESYSPEQAPQVQKQRIRHQRTTRRVSTQSPEPTPNIENGQKNNDHREQRTTKVRRVSHVVNPLENQDEIGRPLNNPGGVVPTNPVGAVEQVTESIEAKPESPKNDQLKLRLDLNLDLEIELKAKIRGDITLQLL